MMSLTKESAEDHYIAHMRTYKEQIIKNVRSLPYSSEDRRFNPVTYKRRDSDDFNRKFILVDRSDHTIKISMEGREKMFGLKTEYSPIDFAHMIINETKKPDLRDTENYLYFRLFRKLITSHLITGWKLIKFTQNPEESHISIIKLENSISVNFNWKDWTMMESGMPSGNYLLKIEFYKNILIRLLNKNKSFSEGDIYAEEQTFWISAFGIYGSC